MQPISWWVKTTRSGKRYEDGSLPAEVWTGGVVAPTLNIMDNTGDSRATVIIFDTGGHGDGVRMTEETTPTLQARMGTGGNNTPMIAYPMQGNAIGRQPQNGPGGKGYGNEADPMFTLTKLDQHGVAVPPATVRRLTPTECERLQGFPDGWTTHRVDEKKGLVEQADSARYKQMGNAVAVPVVDWIMQRLVAVHTGFIPTEQETQ